MISTPRIARPAAVGQALHPAEIGSQLAKTSILAIELEHALKVPSSG